MLRRGHVQGAVDWAGRRPGAPGRRRPSRKGVASVLAMMFVVIFGSLAVAMAIVSKGNLRTAQTHLHVTRSIGAAETGLAVATQRLQEAAARFVADKGVVDQGFGSRLWSGTITGGDGTVTVLPPPSGFSERGLPSGIAEALMNSHAADVNIVAGGSSGLPTAPQRSAAPSGTDGAVYRLTDWVTTPAVAIEAQAQGGSGGPSAYQITYAPLANGTDIRVIVTGYSSLTVIGSGYHYNYDAANRQYKPVARTIQQDMRIAKRHDHAMLSPSRIMIGKNVLVTGKLGARYTDVAQNNGNPVEVKSDFMGLNASLDAKLRRFYQACASYDVDGDNRLRINHPVESQGLPGVQELGANNWAPNAFADSTADGYVDELDLFINHYDRDGDGRVVLSSTLTRGTPHEGETQEFTDDEDLALLIDSASPDRNRNGVSGFDDLNGNGRWDQAEPMHDVDPVTAANADQVLGYRDGVIDRKDQYAKVRGRLIFKTTQQAWNAAQGDYRPHVRGPIVAPPGQSPLKFGATDRELPGLTAASFSNAQTPLKAAADGGTFAQQVAQALGVATSQLATYTEAGAVGRPRFWRADLDDAYVYSRTGRHLYEKMPFNSPAFSDWYYRPRYENMAFKNVRIPMGTNALFVNCTFAGVTYVQSYADNVHANWSLYGRMQWDAAQNRPVAPTAPLDKSDFLRYTTNSVADGPANYAQFPNPPVINGATRTGAARDTKLYSNNIRFHDCLIVGSIVSDTPTAYTHVRNKLQFTGATRFVTAHPTSPTNPDLNPDTDDAEEIAKSSMMLPNYSVDVGSFNSPTDTFPGGPVGGGRVQNVQLKGTVVAGELDMRGTASIDGSLLLTFAPTAGQGPLQQNGVPVGNPAGFNATIGYFGPADGDGESVDPTTLPIVGGQRIVGYDIDGDGLPDLPPDQPPTAAQTAAGARSIPFYGYGRITVNWNPDLPMPDGIALPLGAVVLNDSYREGRQ